MYNIYQCKSIKRDFLHSFLQRVCFIWLLERFFHHVLCINLHIHFPCGLYTGSLEMLIPLIV
jgi:hypothetical protein